MACNYLRAGGSQLLLIRPMRARNLTGTRRWRRQTVSGLAHRGLDPASDWRFSRVGVSVEIVTTFVVVVAGFASAPGLFELLDRCSFIT